MNNKSNIAVTKQIEPFVIEEGKNKTRVEKAAEDVVVAPMPSKATTTVIESKGKNVEEEAIGVAVVREEEQNGGKDIEAAVREDAQMEDKTLKQLSRRFQLRRHRRQR